MSQGGVVEPMYEDISIAIQCSRMHSTSEISTAETGASWIRRKEGIRKRPTVDSLNGERRPRYELFHQKAKTATVDMDAS